MSPQSARRTARRRYGRDPYSDLEQLGGRGVAVAVTVQSGVKTQGLHERLADVSHALAADNRKRRHHKTILGALIWRRAHPDDPESLRELGATLDAYLSADLAEAPTDIKAGAHLPFSPKYRLDSAGIALRRTRRDASAKTLLSALVCRHVTPQDKGALIELLAEYYDVVRPRPLPLAQATGSRAPAAPISEPGPTRSHRRCGSRRREGPAWACFDRVVRTPPRASG